MKPSEHLTIIREMISASVQYRETQPVEQETAKAMLAQEFSLRYCEKLISQRIKRLTKQGKDTDDANA